jgi:DNA-binding NtrC family response regulator
MNPSSHSRKIKVLLVDDEELFLESTSRALAARGCQVRIAGDAEEAILQLESRFFNVVVLDVRMPEMDGMALLRKLNVERPTLKVLMLTGHATVVMAIEAMKLGAFDFLRKPCKIDELIKVIGHAAEQGQLERSNIALKDELARTKGLGVIVGKSDAIKQIHDAIETAASSDLPVLITGESGTGKELVACSIHAHSLRSVNPMVVVDGTTLREELLASELFGHEKGAFTGAVTKKVGLFEVADRGTIFLDEIGEISLANQSSLLRVIELGVFRPVGAVREVKTDVRIIAATNKDIKEAVAKGEFREDLYYRLKGLTIAVGPLRERGDDISLLAEHFLMRLNEATGVNLALSSQVHSVLLSYSWPGNVRELKYVIERAALLARAKGSIELRDLPDDIKIPQQSTDVELNDYSKGNPSLAELQGRYERSYIQRLLLEYDGNKSKVARVLGISRSVLYDKLNRWGLD